MLTRILKSQTATWWLGIVFLLLSSLILYGFSQYSATEQSDGSFLINYFFTAIYFVVLLVSRKMIPAQQKLFHWLLFYALLLVSAWSLNNSMNVFDQPVDWFIYLQGIITVAILIAAFYRYLSHYVNHVILFIIGTGLPLLLYMSCYLFPNYGFGIIGGFGLGISLHVFAPVLLLAGSITLCTKMIRQRKAYRWSLIAGITVTLIITVFFCVRWVNRTNMINSQYRVAMKNTNPDLPLWLQLSQRIPKDELSSTILRAGLSFSMPSDDWSVFRFDRGNNSLNEKKKHDPLVLFASMFSSSKISQEDRVKMLSLSADIRHQAEEKLWTGTDLTTTNVVTRVQLWPEFQLAYTEKTISIRNNLPTTRFRAQQEALYSFYLPEGSVISSLSLWVNGVEEKGVLTTKQKATEAYTTIVGKESRDPSVVHWQEGNVVTVRVFPVLPQAERLFKIGITSPMMKYGERMRYQNTWFRGPDFSKAEETIELEFDKSATDIRKPKFLKEAADNRHFSYDGAYQHAWEVDMDAPKELSSEPFIFQNKAYSFHRYRKQFQQRVFNQYYLDLHSGWDRGEVEKLLVTLRDKQVWVNDEGLKLINISNQRQLLDKVMQQHFSLFPVYAIKDPANSLLITKGNPAAPGLLDMGATPYETKLRSFLQKHPRLATVELGMESSPYIKTLREYRVLDYEKTDLPELAKMIEDRSFPVNQETTTDLLLKDAELIVRESDLVSKGHAPDHLFRLFAYSRVMKQVGETGITEIAEEDSVMNKAEEAHIVTPVSSLIVLEKQADYDRFNIHDNPDHLKNAAINQTGAAPEPHEWVLIILCVVMLAYIVFGKNKRVAIWARR